MDSFLVLDSLYTNVINFMLILTRVFSLMYTFVLFRREMATSKIVVSLSVVISIYVLLLTPIKPITEDILSASYLISTINQFLIGFMAGSILNICFEIATAFGQIISSQIGLTTASLFDPKFGMITSLTNFYLMCSMIIFLMMNGHLLVIQTVVHSFDVIPVDKMTSHLQFMSIFNFASIIFTGSVLISMTVIAAIMMTNVCLAIMSKFAPQFNLFSVGLNMTLIIGLVIVYMTFDTVSYQFTSYITTVLSFFTDYFHMVSHE